MQKKIVLQYIPSVFEILNMDHWKIIRSPMVDQNEGDENIEIQWSLNISKQSSHNKCTKLNENFAC